MPRVVLSRVLPPVLADRIRASVPAVELVDAGEASLPASGRVGLMYLPEHRSAPTVLTEAELEARWKDLLRDAEILFDLHPAAIPLIPGFAPRLRWIQAIAAGAAELFEQPNLRDSGVQIATARGVHDDALADFALAAILSHLKQFEVLRRNQSEHRWQEVPAQPSSAATVCIVGYGSIGTAVAHRARAFGMRVVGVRRTPAPDDLAEQVHGMDDLDRALTGADYVVLALPATPATARIISARRFDAMKPGAFLVNIGRGSTVDEDALLAALESGRLAGAALDVANAEPLPPEDPLWSAPNLLLSPHCASLMPGTSIGRIVDVFIDNLRRDQAALPLNNLALPENAAPAAPHNHHDDDVKEIR